MKQSKKKKIKVTGVKIVCWIFAVLMVIGALAMAIAGIIAMF